MPAIVPAQLAFTPDGTPWSEVFGDVYHSADGGLGQARQVFLAGNGLPGRWASREHFTILETGFGLGLNFLATWAAWRNDPQRCRRLHFVSVEKHPFSAADLTALHARWPEFAELSAELRRLWPCLVPGFHRLNLDGGRVVLTLILGEALDGLRQLRARADAFYLDGFSPATNPDLWSPPLFKTISRLAASGATAATYTVAAVVRDGLAGAGFQCEKRPGFGGKRSCLAARFEPRFPDHDPVRPVGERHALVIGAGIAGTSVCERLADRGWELDLIERRDEPGREASGNHAGLLLPLISRDDSRASRISRACFLHALRALQTLDGARWGQSGVLQLAKDPRHEALQRATIEALRFPPEFAAYLESGEAGALIGRALEQGGWHFPMGAWAHPPGICRALMERHGDRVRRHFATTAISLEWKHNLWRVLDQEDHTLAAAPVLILANGADAPAFVQAAHLPLRKVRGQVSHLPAGLFSAPTVAMCREGYVTPDVDGMAALGASYDLDDDDPEPRVSGHEANLARLERLLPGAAARMDPETMEGKVGFRPATLDRLPLVGALPSGLRQEGARETQLRHLARHPGLYGALGYGSRGLVWAPLMAELLASQLEGEPLPLESDLMESLDPGRFLLRASRQGRGFSWVSED
ncbi:MAG: bifunctional tRNA (5-methylaminomethyl-2-thiouridine)(34)-methyltransferase MnmD/FAD-dependent 5-carboxymethylaminomethyl-2-thiouridine(34) oxidoreductase MnmC [Rhodocyclaceae bacterium]|nr:bifunctional tRNA (5-methylaminomethyl-2-thiouridine)(34)-methyltransferase MnmD/FAD-dependent 5-carboxymethylaminomethyl-2-thiouridine(34) oxidoreductase MnmC [Rhodocyclaceae bacterium]